MTDCQSAQDSRGCWYRDRQPQRGSLSARLNFLFIIFQLPSLAVTVLEASYIKLGPCKTVPGTVMNFALIDRPKDAWERLASRGVRTKVKHIHGDLENATRGIRPNCNLGVNRKREREKRGFQYSRDLTRASFWSDLSPAA